MHEKIIEIPTADGRMETFITHPEADGPFAPVVIYMDVWGLREELYDIARKVAVVGYYVLLPDLYYRQGRIRHQWRNERGQMISMHNLEPERQAQVRAPLQKLSEAMVVADSGAILKFLARGEPVRHGAVGSIGYCMGAAKLSASPAPISNASSPVHVCMAPSSSPRETIPRTVLPTDCVETFTAVSPRMIPMPHRQYARR